jgi:SAM-dependent methyltransferase
MDDRLTPAFRENLRAIWRELEVLEPASEFGNIEGGSVEQQQDRRLQLHHCANYAAVLTLLRRTAGDGRLRVLELGCGSGALSFALARVMPEGWSVVGTDYSEKLLSGARQRFGHPRLCFERLDVRQMARSDLEGIDVVMLLEVIEHLTPAEAADMLHRVHGALRPGGRLLLTTLDRTPFPRPFSGYAPHRVEYTYRSLCDFLAGPASPFAACEVYRLGSSRVASESVRAEQRGGYLANRFQRLVLALGRGHGEFTRYREQLESALFRVYAMLPRSDGFEFEPYFHTMSLGTGVRDSDSFGLVAMLVNAAGAEPRRNDGGTG